MVTESQFHKGMRIGLRFSVMKFNKLFQAYSNKFGPNPTPAQREFLTGLQKGHQTKRDAQVRLGNEAEEKFIEEINQMQQSRIDKDFER